MNTENPLVSVIVPTYNQEEFIEETLNSIIKQSYENLEIIVSDDASTDKTPSIIKAFAEKDKRIHAFFSEQNKGISGNFNKAFDACTGEYITFFSGDDIMLPQKIEKQVRFLEQNKDCPLVMHQVEIFNSETGEINTIHKNTNELKVPKTPIEWAFPTKWFYKKHYTGLLPTSFTARAPYYLSSRYDVRLRYKHELLFHLDIYMKNPKTEWKMIPEVLSRYRVHDNNFTKNKNLLKLREQEKFLIHAIVMEKYPALAKQSRSFIHFTMFENILFFNFLEKDKNYLTQFLREAGVFKFIYLQFSRILHQFNLLFPVFKVIRLLFRVK